MKRKMLLAAVAVLAAILSAKAKPGQTGNEWMAFCNDKLLTLRVLCHQYALGVADGLYWWQETAPVTAIVCLPQRVTAEQLVDVARKYFRENPNQRHNPAGAFLTLAFQDAWSCSDAGNPGPFTDLHRANARRAAELLFVKECGGLLSDRELDRIAFMQKTLGNGLINEAVVALDDEREKIGKERFCARVAKARK